MGNATIEVAALSNTFNGGHAVLYVYSPLKFGTQALRPYSYNITGNALDILADPKATSMSEQLGRKDIVSRPEVAGSIVPVGNCIELDMSTTNELWTFVLQIDIVSPWLSGGSMSGVTARRRVQYNGVFLDEPILPHTLFSSNPIPNNECRMRFTHVTEMIIDPGASRLGDGTRVTVRQDADVIDSVLDAQANDTDLYLSTPDKLLGNHRSSEITTEGLAALCNYSQGVGVISDLKSPLAHLRALCMGIDQQVSICESASGNTVGSHMSGTTDIYDVDTFKQGVVGEWSQMSSTLNESSGAVDPGSLVRLGYLITKFPDITIVPHHVGTESGYTPQMMDGAVMDPTTIDPKAIYSSMVASAVAAIASNFGLSSVNFSYDSYHGQYGCNPTGVFKWNSAYLAMPPSNPESGKELLRHAIQMFERQLILDLVPCIRASKNGEFQMHVSYSSAAETYVDFNFYDYASLAQNGIYETTNRIANVTSTSVMDVKNFINNGAALDSVVHAVWGKHIDSGFRTNGYGNDQGDLIVADAGENGNYDY